jgi:hypothetical protein
VAASSGAEGGVTAHAADIEASDSARFALARTRLMEADRARMAELDRLIAATPPDPEDDMCRHGHLLDGVKADRGGRTKRYCKTCHREREAERHREKRKRAKALVRGTAPEPRRVD